MLDPAKTLPNWEAETNALTARITALEAENARLRLFRIEAGNILLELTSGIIRVMEEQVRQAQNMAGSMQEELDKLKTQEPSHAE